MGRYFALALNLGGQVQTKPKSQKTKSSKINYGFWIVVLLIVFGIAYLMQVNSTSTKGYEIKKLETKLTGLREQQKRLELEEASLKSIKAIETQVKSLNLVPSENVNYPKTKNGYAYQ